MRLFISVDLPAKLAESLVDLQKELLKYADVSKTPVENMHFTLKFLGEKTAEEKDKILGVVDELAKNYPSFETSLEGLGAFPSIARARIIWVGCPEMTDLQKLVNESLVGILPSDSHIVPHLTIARVKRIKDKSGLKRFIEDIRIKQPFYVNELRLKKSVLSRTGAVYSDEGIFPLSKNALP